MISTELINKYHVPAPRYTSYPTVPYWNTEPPDPEQWLNTVIRSFNESNASAGISLYIHLPFCESLCTYCGCNTRITKNHQVEEPYIAAVIKEWNMYRERLPQVPQIREIHLGGGTPTFFSPENLEKLISAILATADRHPEAEFSFEAHPANTTEEHLHTLYKLGFRRLSLGIQDFDPRVQIIINRIQTYNQVKDVTNLARTTGYSSINYDLIYGLPLQSKSGLIETISKTLSLRPDRIAFYAYAHVPWIKPGQRRYTEADLPSAEEKRILYETGRAMLTAGGYEEIGMDHFALRTDTLYESEQDGSLHRNFMGYTHNYTQLMIGLGVSSISDSWYAFTQNLKKVEDYREAVDRGEFPIFKGHQLNDEDRLIRKHILNIMCQGTTNWDDPSTRCDALTEAMSRLQELEEDGLVLLGERSITVTIKGKRFLRNVCMALDARLWRKQPESTMFSMA